ncbi:hypothetical protein HMPREF0005_01431 [Achromobacter xylosoxidans C54]|nr:hypothetical protein HMPREF0005_01431 [Achromobacter xylosoxidans C54]
MAYAQIGDAQLRALPAGGKGGAQVAEFDRQRLAILQQVEFAQRQPVDGDRHRQGGQCERFVVAGVGRRFPARGQRDLDAAGGKLAHVQQAVTQRAPAHRQPQVADADAGSADVEIQPPHFQPPQDRPAHVQRLTVQLLGSGGQQQPRAGLRGQQPEYEAAGQHRQHRQPRQPPHQEAPQESAQPGQNAIPSEKCRRRSRSR